MLSESQSKLVGTSRMIYSVVKGKTVGCPQCQEEYYVNRSLYDTVTRCSRCQCIYFIKPPGTAPYDPAEDSDVDDNASDLPQTTDTSSSRRPRRRRAERNIQLVKGDDLTQTMPLNRGMGMRQRRSRRSAPQNASHDLKHTMPLNRSGMSMKPRRSRRKAAQDDLKYTMPMRRGGMSMEPRVDPNEGSAQASNEGAANDDSTELVAVATDHDVGCPVCGTRSIITPEFYEKYAECMACNSLFMVRTPGTEIGVAPPAIIGDLYAVAGADDVSCPQCSSRFDVTEEHYESAAQCSECGCVFVIKPPGTEPCSISLGQPLQPVNPKQPFKQSSIAAVMTTSETKHPLATSTTPLDKMLDFVDSSLPRSKGLYIGIFGVVLLLLTVAILMVILLIESF